ncbi:hypothetical protein [Anaerocellum danielii]|uniref:Uncharacterized protein n=1 Tax=Anaerocellum danielii TaxID=1387557 RepID=A0ABZ0U030_9FIRM|nr:hypothetical protein [Caldicellulosiruptor danielii]WPX09081.1 hypothetical protein SOJ16_000255 [Caldicellulosiruptor danielii]
MDEIKQMIGLVLEKVNKISDDMAEVKHRLEVVEQRLDKVEHRLEVVEQRLDKVEHRLEVVEQRLDKVEHRLEVVEQRLDALEKRLDVLEQRVEGLERRVDGLERRIDRLEVETTKNSVMLEELKRKLELMAEIQESYMQQNAREHEELKKYIDDRISIVELAVRRLSDDIRTLKEDVRELKENRVNVEVFYEILGRHEVEISRLKKALQTAS